MIPKTKHDKSTPLIFQQRKFFTSFNKLIFNGLNILCVILVDVHFSILFTAFNILYMNKTFDFIQKQLMIFCTDVMEFWAIG